MTEEIFKLLNNIVVYGVLAYIFYVMLILVPQIYARYNEPSFEITIYDEYVEHSVYFNSSYYYPMRLSCEFKHKSNYTAELCADVSEKVMTKFYKVAKQ